MSFSINRRTGGIATTFNTADILTTVPNLIEPPGTLMQYDGAKWNYKSDIDVVSRANLILKARNINTEIYLTFVTPKHTIPLTSIVNTIHGSVPFIVKDFTGPTKDGEITLSIFDSVIDANMLIAKLGLMSNFNKTSFTIQREGNTQSTKVFLQTQSSTHSFIKLSKLNGLLESPDSNNITLWDPETDDPTMPYTVTITATQINTRAPQIKLCATQLNTVTKTNILCPVFSSTPLFDPKNFICEINNQYDIISWNIFGNLNGFLHKNYAYVAGIQKASLNCIPYRYKPNTTFYSQFTFDSLPNLITDDNTTVYKLSKHPELIKNSASTPPILLNIRSEIETSPSEITSVSFELKSGNFGDIGAIYQISGNGIGKNRDLFYVIDVIDKKGLILNGFGPNSFLPLFLTAEQRNRISSVFNDDIENYLTTFGDDFDCQGVYSFSLPFLEVTNWLTYSSVGTSDISTSNDKGVLSMDISVQTVNNNILESFSNFTYNYFMIKFTDTMDFIIILETSCTGGEYVSAKYYKGDDIISYASDSVIISGMDQITIDDRDYYTKFNISLMQTGNDISMGFTAVYSEQISKIDGNYEGIGVLDFFMYNNQHDTGNNTVWIEQKK